MPVAISGSSGTKGTSSNFGATKTKGKKSVTDPKKSTTPVYTPTSGMYADPAKQPIPQALKSTYQGPVAGLANTANQSFNTASTSQPVGTSGNNNNFDPAHTDPMTGFAGQQGYTPVSAQSIYDNPNILSGDVLKAMGIDNMGITNLLGDQMDPLRKIQFILNGGQGANDNNLTDNATINWLAEALGQMATPGGRTPEADVLMQALLGTGNVSGSMAQQGSVNAGAMGASPSQSGQSPLWAYLNSGLNPDQQTQAMNSLAQAAAMNQNPYMQQATQRYLGDQATGYLGSIAHGGQGASPNYGKYLQGSALGDWYRT